MFSTMKKILRLEDMAAGGRRREHVFDLLGLRIIVFPREGAPESHAVEVGSMFRAEGLGVRFRREEVGFMEDCLSVLAVEVGLVLWYRVYVGVVEVSGFGMGLCPNMRVSVRCEGVPKWQQGTWI